MKLTPEIIKLLPGEISIMQKSEHPCIVKYIGSYKVGKDCIWVCNTFIITLFILL